MKHRDAGISLIEIVIAIVILGAATAVLMSAIITAALGSKTHRELATQDTVMRSYAEAVKQAVRNTCPPSGGGTFTVSYTQLSGYTASANSTACPADAKSTAPITVSVSRPDQPPKSMQIVVRIP